MATYAQLKASRLRAGYTRHVIIECGADDYYGWIKPAANLAATVTLIEDNASGTIRNFKAPT